MDQALIEVKPRSLPRHYSSTMAAAAHAGSRGSDGEWLEAPCSINLSGA
jgi:hypothetical protein